MSDFCIFPSNTPSKVDVVFISPVSILEIRTVLAVKTLTRVRSLHFPRGNYIYCQFDLKLGLLHRGTWALIIGLAIESACFKNAY
jgi:hypothetical protein